MISEQKKAGLSSSELAVSKCLDMLIEEREFCIAIQMLQFTETSFPLQNDYLIEIDQAINAGDIL